MESKKYKLEFIGYFKGQTLGHGLLKAAIANGFDTRRILEVEKFRDSKKISYRVNNNWIDIIGAIATEDPISHDRVIDVVMRQYKFLTAEQIKKSLEGLANPIALKKEDIKTITLLRNSLFPKKILTFMLLEIEQKDLSPMSREQLFREYDVKFQD